MAFKAKAKQDFYTLSTDGETESVQEMLPLCIVFLHASQKYG